MVVGLQVYQAMMHHVDLDHDERDDLQKRFNEHRDPLSDTGGMAPIAIADIVNGRATILFYCKLSMHHAATLGSPIFYYS